MKRIHLSIIFLLSAVAAASAQSYVRGNVFEDSNQNGRRERKEKGIPGVPVSNGVAVVATDQHGEYQLPVGDDNIIFVIKPSGFKVPLNDKNQPQFYYIHKPGGHPSSFQYRGSAPTGKLPERVDFGLQRVEEADEFTALIFGDPQPYTKKEVGHFARGIVEEVAGVKNALFGLSLGDLVGDDLDLHGPYIDATKRVGIPWYNVMGNHDMNYEATTDSLSDETYEFNFGPANYSFNYGKVHFIILDDILYPDPRDGKGYWGGFREAQLKFIENDLKLVDKDKLIVMAFHIPLQLNGDSYRREDRQRLFDLLKDYPNTLSLSAHTHLQRHNFYSAEDGWGQPKPHHEYNAGTTSGDWYSGELDQEGIPVSTMRDGTPKGYAFIHFTRNQYTIDYKVAGRPKEYQMEIYSPKVIPHRARTSAGIFVNFFMGTQNDTVEYRIGDGDWQRMTYVEDTDPSYDALLYKWDITESLMPGRRPSNAVKSTHLWRAGFPAGLSLGEHIIEVSAVDMFGRRFTQRKTIKVEEPILAR